MFRIFGNTNSVTIIRNGQVISAGDECGEKRTFDEVKNEHANDVDSLSIDCVCGSVTVMEKNTSNITVHFSGTATVVGDDLKFSAEVVNRELRVRLKTKGNIIGGNLKINITIPSEKTFKKFSFESKSTDLEILGRVLTREFEAETMSGDVSGEVSFKNAFVKTMSGDIDLEILAKDDVTLRSTSMSGDISARLHNIGRVILNTKSMSGDVTNRHNESTDGYTANIDASTMSGDIKIK